MSINRVCISGNLTREPELRATNGGMPILRFGVAVNDRRKNQQTGEWEDYPNFIDCTMFGNRAQSVAQYLHKGSKVSIEGKLRYSSWQAQDGTKRSKLEVIVDEIEFMSQQGQQPKAAPQAYAQAAPAAPMVQQPAQYQQPVQQQAYAQPVQVVEPQSVYEEEIPF